MNHEVDIYRFKKVYKHLTEERGWKVGEITSGSGLFHATVQKLLWATKKDIPKFQASTWAKVQDFNAKYIGEIEDTGVPSGVDETVSEYLNENGNNIELAEVRPKTIGECDVFDLLRAMSDIPGVKINVSLSVEPYVSSK